MNFINANAFTTNSPLVEAYFKNDRVRRKFIRIFFQDEHNLVLPGGRSIGKGDPIGEVASMFDPAERYHVRIAKKKYYYSSDIIIEYNMPNIENIRRAQIFPAEIAEGIIYCPSIPFSYYNGCDRDLPVISNYINEAEPRRSWVIQSLRKSCPGYQNIQGIYDLCGLRSLYSSARIIVNSHQTWHHHSIEEFRVLPALSRGCIVISEDVPLRTQIPYHEYIVWCDYREIPDVTLDVQENYESYFEKIHGKSSRLSPLLQSMQEEFAASMDRLISNESHFSVTSRLKRRLAWMVKS